MSGLKEFYMDPTDEKSRLTPCCGSPTTEPSRFIQLSHGMPRISPGKRVFRFKADNGFLVASNSLRPRMSAAGEQAGAFSPTRTAGNRR